MRDNHYSSEEYRDWMTNILHENDADELISLLVPYGKEELLKTELIIYKSASADKNPRMNDLTKQKKG